MATFTQSQVDEINARSLAGKIKNEKRFQPHDPVSHSQQRELPKALEADCGREAPRPGLRHCRFTLRRKKLLDVDAKYASVKDLLDCLTISGIIRGDKEGEITLEVNQEKITKGETEETEIEVLE